MDLRTPADQFREQRARMARTFQTTDFSLKSGNLTGSVRAPNRIAPGGVVDVVPEMNNRANVILFDPDRCSAGTFEGYEYTVTVDPEWTSSVSQTVCHTMEFDVIGSETFDFSFTAPSDTGTYDITVTVTLSDSGEADSTTMTLLVEEDAPVRDDPGGQEDCEGVQFFGYCITPLQLILVGVALFAVTYGGGSALVSRFIPDL